MEMTKKDVQESGPERAHDQRGHAWKGSWNRPMLVNEKGIHPFTIARMTDHNVRGSNGDFVNPISSRSRRLIMKRNVGVRERYGRIGVGVLSGVGAIFLPAGTVVRAALGIIGLAGLGTGVTRYCPANQILGIDNYGGAETEKEKNQEKPAAAA